MGRGGGEAWNSGSYGESGSKSDVTMMRGMIRVIKKREELEGLEVFVHIYFVFLLMGKRRKKGTLSFIVLLLTRAYRTYSPSELPLSSPSLLLILLLLLLPLRLLSVLLHYPQFYLHEFS